MLSFFTIYYNPKKNISMIKYNNNYSYFQKNENQCKNNSYN